MSLNENVFEGSLNVTIYVNGVLVKPTENNLLEKYYLTVKLLYSVSSLYIC